MAREHTFKGDFRNTEFLYSCYKKAKATGIDLHTQTPWMVEYKHGLETWNTTDASDFNTPGLITAWSSLNDN